MEPLHITIIQSRCWHGAEIYSFPNFFSFIYYPSFSHIQKRIKKLFIPIPISLFSFVNDGLFVFQEKSYEKSNAILYSSYSINSALLLNITN